MESEEERKRSWALLCLARISRTASDTAIRLLRRDGVDKNLNRELVSDLRDIRLDLEKVEKFLME